MRAADFDRIIIVDIETTGLGPQVRLGGVAWIQVDHDLNEVARAGSLISTKTASTVCLLSRDEHSLR